MSRFIHSILRQDVTESDGTVTIDLPTHPISHIIYTVKVLNAVANTKATLAQILGGVEKVEVLYKGSAILSMSGSDLYALNCVLFGKEPWQENVVNTDDATRMLTLIIPFGTSMYSSERCLFSTKKGELQLKLTLDVADTGYDGMISQIEVVELVDASASEHIKVTTLNKTAIVGDFDVDLPIGNRYLGILLFSATVPTGIAWTTTIDKIKLMLDNVQYDYAETNWESLHGMLMNRLSPAGAWGEKFHRFTYDPTLTAVTSADTDTEEQDNSDIANYALLDFGLGMSEDFILDSKGLSRFHLRITGGDNEALRILPIELTKME